MKNRKNITDRKQLKAFFSKGSLPNESAFEKLIDSTFNKADDKLDINEDGLIIYPSDNGKEKLLSFFDNKDDSEATWVLFTSNKENGGIFLRQLGKADRDNNLDEENIESPAFFIQKKNWKVGLGTNTPVEKLDVRGLIASEGRVGNFRKGELDADGKWHNIFSAEGLKQSNAFEIMAYVEGERTEGKYSLLHATAISTYGNSKPKITKTCAYYGKRWNRIAIRWESRPSRISEETEPDEKRSFDIFNWWKKLWESEDTFNYNLQIKTRSNYGNGKKIYFKVSKLWDSNFIKRV